MKEESRNKRNSVLDSAVDWPFKRLLFFFLSQSFPRMHCKYNTICLLLQFLFYYSRSFYYDALILGSFTQWIILRTLARQLAR